MARCTRTIILMMAIFLGLAGSASATTYYIAANGSDSNSGTSKTSPWLHAPGMTGCSGTCSSTTPQPGDSFIFRGGDTWHYNSAQGSPVGLPWNWSWSGSSSGCQLNPSAGTVNKSSCIYIGVDTSWYSGSSWARPAFNLDNPLSTSRPSSCTYDDTSVNAINFGSQNYLILDNFEMLGECWQGDTNASFVTTMGTQVEVSNNYFHGWTYGSNSTSDSYLQIGGNMPKGNYILVDHNVFDGSDSSLGTTPGQASGKAVGSAKEIAYNVFSHVSNGCVCNPASVHDNLFEYMYEPQGSVHGNIVEWNNPNSATGTALYFFNNIMHDTNEGEGIDIESTNGQAVYVFNNVSWRYRENSDGSNGTDGTNCFMIDVASGTTSAIQFFNNSIDYPCSARNITGGAAMTTSQNNQLIGFGSTSMSGMMGGGLTVSDAGSEIFESESTANSQGYTTSDNYAPTSSGDPTVGAGAILNTVICATITDSGASAACKNGMVGVSYDVVNHATVAGQLVARNSAWDVGAYEFSSTTVSSQPSPPTALTAAVQ